MSAPPAIEESDLGKVQDPDAVRKAIMRLQVADGLVMASRRVEQLIHGDLRRTVVQHFDRQKTRVADSKGKVTEFQPAVVLDVFSLHELWTGAEVKFLSDPKMRSIVGNQLAEFSETVAKQCACTIVLLVDVPDTSVGNTVLRAAAILTVDWSAAAQADIKTANASKRANQLLAAGVDVRVDQNAFSAFVVRHPRAAPAASEDGDGEADDEPDDAKLQAELRATLDGEIDGRCAVHKSLLHMETLQIVGNALLFKADVLAELRASVAQAEADKRPPMMSALLIRTQNRRLAQAPTLLSRAQLEASIEQRRAKMKPDTVTVYLRLLEMLGASYPDSKPHDVVVLIEDCGTGPLLGTMVRAFLDHVDLTQFEKLIERAKSKA